MGKTTAIAYCDSTINPVIGCSGCELLGKLCYAEDHVRRYAGKPGYPRTFTEPLMKEDRIAQALRWSDLTGTKRADKPWLDGLPRVIFLNDLSDTFAPALPIDWLAPWLPRIAASPHVWLLLTKWPARMHIFADEYPLPANVWPGTTVTSQAQIGRLASLSMIDSGGPHWASFEPLLGPVDPTRIGASLFDALRGREGRRALDWIAAGGASGRNAPPSHPQWVRSVRDQCAAAAVRFFFKQWGEWAETYPGETPFTRVGDIDFRSDGKITGKLSSIHCRADGTIAAAGYQRFLAVLGLGPYTCERDDRLGMEVTMRRVGKAAAGRLLDGRGHTEMPRW